MGTNYKAIFKYTGVVTEPLKAIMAESFVKTWNEMAEDSENRFKKWNTEYGNITSLDDYEKFIAAKIQSYLDEHVNNREPDQPIKYKADTIDAGNIIGYLTSYPDTTVTMYLKPM